MSRIQLPGRLAAGLRRNAYYSTQAESLGLLSRVSHLNEILGNDRTSYTEKSRQCHEYYRAGKAPKTAIKSQKTGPDTPAEPVPNAIHTTPNAESKAHTSNQPGPPTPHLNLIKDMSRYREINTDVIKRICYIFTRNSSMRAFLLQQILENIRSHDFGAVNVAYELMEECMLLSEEQSVQLSSFYNRISRLAVKHTRELEMEVLHTACNLLLSICISSGESLLAVALADTCCEISPAFRHHIRPAILDGILLSLSVHDPVHRNYKAYSVFKMLRVFPAEAVPLATCFKMMSNMSVDAGNPFFVNTLFDHVTSDPRASAAALAPHELELFLPILKNLIALNLHHGNVYRAAQLWLSLGAAPEVSRRFLEHNSVLLEAILHAIQGPEIHRRDQTVSQLLQGVDLQQYPHLLDFALEFYGQRASPQFDNLVKLLQPPLGRSTLSALFSALLAQNKEKAAERIMQTIFRTQRGLNAWDFEVIVKKLLSQNKFAECIDMFRETNFSVAGRGSTHILMHLLTQRSKTQPQQAEDLDGQTEASEKSKMKKPQGQMHSELEKQRLDDFVQALTTKMHCDSDSWHHFTVEIFRYISRNINNRVSRRIYEARAFVPAERKHSLHFEMLGLPAELEPFVTINCTNRVLCLMVMMKQAQLEADRSMITWCADELQHVGVPVSDIESHFMNA